MSTHVGPRAEDVKSIFSSVAEGYDRANDVMTFGMARIWRRDLVRWSQAKPGDSVLDCATGTGDLALEFKRAVGNSGRVIGTDFCEDMLKKAPPKAKAQGLDIEFCLADAMHLQFADSMFDICSIAYGIRNVSDPTQALSEMARVTRKNGHVMVLETGDTPALGLKGLMDFYLRQVVPRVGGWLTGQRSAYEYLNRSSRGFPSRERFLDLMKSTGKFSQVEYKSILGGASFLYRGTVG